VTATPATPAPTRKAVKPQAKAARPAVAFDAEAWGRREAEAEKAGATRLPAETVADIRSSGLLAAPVPRELGGEGWDLRQCMQALRKIAAHAPATALALAMPLGNAGAARVPDEAVPAAQRKAVEAGRRWTVEQCLAGRILAVANSEPGSGGDLANTKATARLDKDGAWRLTGFKAFATGGPDGDFFLCAARTPQRVEGFFVARDAPGAKLNDDWNGLGMRTSASVTLKLDDAPAAAILGYPGSLDGGVNARHWSTLLFGSVFVGVGEGALTEAAQAVAHQPVLRGQLAERALALEAAWGYLDSVAGRDAFPFPKAELVRAQRAKSFAADAAVQAAVFGSMAAGGRGYSAGSRASKFLRDALAGPHLRPPLPQVLEGLAQEWEGKAPKPKVTVKPTGVPERSA
jgi:alkylation response protein AidB-like acyl-CoA dehydrogenase